jgi:hypothetical protein
MIIWVLNLNITSPNRSQHWGSRSRINNKNKAILAKQWATEPHKIRPPCTVIIQRLYNPSKFHKRWDDDNWIMGCKGIRDTLASFLMPGLAPGQADHPKYNISFQYDQLTATRKGVRIVIKTPEDEDDFF